MLRKFCLMFIASVLVLSALSAAPALAATSGTAYGVYSLPSGEGVAHVQLNILSVPFLGYQCDLTVLSQFSDGILSLANLTASMAFPVANMNWLLQTALVPGGTLGLGYGGTNLTIAHSFDPSFGISLNLQLLKSGANGLDFMASAKTKASYETQITGVGDLTVTASADVLKNAPFLKPGNVQAMLKNGDNYLGFSIGVADGQKTLTLGHDF